ncbi:MAG: thioredoxin domain-containing protein [Burkholderiales bacterium]|nr:thioredoxin domain-containing protein [Burkholderiales bacterium]
MSKKVEFLFDFASPTAYLAYTQLPRIAEQQGAEIIWTPILLGGVHKACGNQSPVLVPAKGRWMFGDIAKWAKRYGVAFETNPNFPVNTIALMRGAVGVQMRMPDQFPAYVEALYKAMWVTPRNLGEPSEVAAALNAAGLDAQKIFALVGEQDVKDKLKANSDDAVARGVFGAPTFFVHDEMFFGQDRLDFVAEALAA